jgi:hypothetical protein
METYYQVDPLIEISPEDRQRYYEALQPLCSPPGTKGLDTKEKIVLSTDPQLMLGRLYTAADDKVVGGILYEDQRRVDKVNGIRRGFVCVESGKGYLDRINQGFEEGVLASNFNGEPIRVSLYSVVDDNLNVAGAHMRNGYIIEAKKPEDALVHEKYDILMRRYLPSPRPTPEEQAKIKEMVLKARGVKQQLREKKEDRERRRADAAEISAKRPKYGGRRRITRRRSSTSARKQSRRRRASVRGA